LGFVLLDPILKINIALMVLNFCFDSVDGAKKRWAPRSSAAKTAMPSGSFCLKKSARGGASGAPWGLEEWFAGWALKGRASVPGPPRCSHGGGCKRLQELRGHRWGGEGAAKKAENPSPALVRGEAMPDTGGGVRGMIFCSRFWTSNAKALHAALCDPEERGRLPFGVLRRFQSHSDHRM
jgi:hypothetical protein